MVYKIRGGGGGGGFNHIQQVAYLVPWAKRIKDFQLNIQPCIY